MFPKLVVLSLILASTHFYGIDAAEDVKYADQARWYDQYPECILDRQSPIELISTEAVLSYDILPLTFNYNVSWFSPVLDANIHGWNTINLTKPPAYNTSQWQVDDQELSRISGGLLNGTFIAETLHFHWGSNYTHGSEHVIDTRRYALEMHILHRNTKYQTVAEAQLHPDGLTVVAVLFNVSTEVDFEPLNTIIAADEVALTTPVQITLDDLLGDIDRGNFYTYLGSLTTPPCSQAVTWNVFEEAIHISKQQMKHFHDIHLGNMHDNNYRALQAKGTRVINLRRNRESVPSV